MAWRNAVHRVPLVEGSPPWQLENSLGKFFYCVSCILTPRPHPGPVHFGLGLHSAIKGLLWASSHVLLKCWEGALVEYVPQSYVLETYPAQSSLDAGTSILDTPASRTVRNTINVFPL